jgi:hypothetical protein
MQASARTISRKPAHSTPRSLPAPRMKFGSSSTGALRISAGIDVTKVTR